MKVLLKAPMNRMTGYGNDGIDIARFLDKAGVDLRLWPESVLPPLPEDVLHLFARPVDKSGYDVALQFNAPFDISVRERLTDRYSQSGVPHGLAKMHVGWSMWERSKLARDDMRGHSLGPHPWRLLDLMYVTTPMNVEAFRSYDARPEYRVMPCGIDGEMFPIVERDLDGPIRFCMVGMLHQRKDPFLAIEAFRELREEVPEFDAELTLKTSMHGLHPGLADLIPGLTIISEGWQYERLIEWMTTQHVYVSVSRGEGNHKPPMEFMATGGPVIAPLWSGPENWMTEDAGWVVDHVMKPFGKDERLGVECRVIKESLKEKMLHAWQHRLEVRDKGMYASKWIRWVADWRQLIDRLLSQLRKDLIQRS